MKKLFFLIVLVLSVLHISAQTFSFANKFSGECRIVSVDVDSQDNIYVLGYSTYMAAYQGESIGHMNHQTTFILKIDSKGNLLWKKLVYETDYDLPTPHGMRLVGDSALYVFVSITLPTPLWSIYYFDTLLTYGDTNYLFPSDSISNRHGTVLAVLDKDGALREHHFFKQVAVDDNGNPIPNNAPNSVPSADGMRWTAPFMVDPEGYVYLTTRYLHHERSCPGIGMLLDGRVTCRLMLPASGHGTPILMKLTPHMDSVVWCRSIIQGIDTSGSGRRPDISDNSFIRGIALDPQNNVYTTSSLSCYGSGDTANYFPYPEWHDWHEFVDTNWYVAYILDSSDLSKRVKLDFGMNHITFMQKFDADGNMLAYKKFNIQPIHPMQAEFVFIRWYLYSPVYNADNGKLYFAARFMGGAITDTIQFFNIQLNDDDTLINNIRLCCGFLEVDPATLRVTNYGMVPASILSRFANGDITNPQIGLLNNQIFAQVKYSGGQLTSHESEPLVNDDRFTDAMAFVRFHQDGHVISAIDYNSLSNRNIGDPIAIDSHGDIILTGTTFDPNTTFGDYNIGAGTYIAKLHDPSFNEPYTPTPKEQSILWTEDLTLPVGNPYRLNAVATSGLPVDYAVDTPVASRTVARISHDTLFPLAPGTATLRANQPGDAWWLPAPEVARTVTITSSGNTNAIAPVNPEDILSVEYYDVLGRSWPDFHSLPRGIYLERTVTTRGTSTRKVVITQ